MQKDTEQICRNTNITIHHLPLLSSTKRNPLKKWGTFLKNKEWVVIFSKV
jgi:hypothetical protein